MDERWLQKALALAAAYALCKGSLDVAHVLGDAKFYAHEKGDEKKAWDDLKAHLRTAVEA